MIDFLKLPVSILLLGLLQACATPVPVVAPCKAYCKTQPEGYQWAQDAHLGDSRNCEGYAPAFTQGCRDAVNDYRQSLAPGRDGL